MNKEDACFNYLFYLVGLLTVTIVIAVTVIELETTDRIESISKESCYGYILDLNVYPNNKIVRMLNSLNPLDAFRMYVELETFKKNGWTIDAYIFEFSYRAYAVCPPGYSE